MRTATYPDQTRYAWRAGATCLTVPRGAVLLNPPHSEKLTGLGAAQLQILRTLNRGPSTFPELSSAPSDEVAPLLDRLAAGGWLTITVRHDNRDLYTIQPFGIPATQPGIAAATPPKLSKFSVLHRDSADFVLENPMSWCDLRISDPRIVAFLGGLDAAASGLPDDIAARIATDLVWCGFAPAAPADEEQRFATRSWSAPDLWFHRRSTLGQRTVTWDHFGPTKWAKGSYPQPPARKAVYPGAAIELAVPDLTALRATDPTLAAVLEDRRSCRAFDDAAPITGDQLAELLYRTARTREVRPAGEGEELVSRPYPSGGSVYELEFYPVVRHVDGVPQGMYHYDSFDHVLRPVAAADSPEVQRLLRATSATLAEGAEPQLLIVLAARAGRMMWTYEQIAYATILKHVGVVMQTVYLAATAMGLGVCAQGFGDTAAFAQAAGVDELEECSVGSLIVGSPAPH
ncbi:SagB family peptide dehydrogenase [Nocardia sp. NPDC051787]|uniref:SagB family peptide dehydrogenase n=1 Tax=Nocardia sp. NPDC051787 TaxID=3155415 RepID=UPI0034205C3C